MAPPRMAMPRRHAPDASRNMRKATDTTLRSLAMLQAIPAHPRSKSTRQIMDDLRDLNPDFDVTVRSVQRSLEQLSATFPIASDMRGRTNHWFWVDKNALTQIPAMSAPTAFVLRLAAEYLKPIMPPSVLRQLDAYFRQAERVLGDTALGRWADKAAIIRHGPPLKPPMVRDDVQEAVYSALLDNRRIEVGYRNKARSRSKRMVLSPLGLVVRDGVVYLVATAWNYRDIRHFVLHRMSKPTLLDEAAKAPPEFRLASHVREHRRFSYPRSTGKLELKVLFDADAAVHLTESRLAADHRTTEQEDGRVLVEATVPDTNDLRWWLLGFGSGAEVLAPETLRSEFRDQAARMGAIYGIEG